MTNLSIDLPDQLAEQLTTLSAETGRSAADMIAEALNEYLGDLEDLAIAERRRADVLSGKEQTVPLADVMQRYGLED
jgi:RHH-type transcriptional regulator, rel operon repressor / antitoxin RelB